MFLLYNDYKISAKLKKRRDKMVYGLPEMIKSLRKKFGLSQKALAEKIGVSASIISGYETGERTPSVESLLAMSKLFNCSTDVMLGRSGSQQSNTLSVEGLTKRQLEALERLIEVLNDKEN